MCVSKSTVYNYIKESPKIRDAVLSGRKVTVAMVEDVLFRQAMSGAGWAVKLFLETHDRDAYKYEEQRGCWRENIDADLVNEAMDVMEDCGDLDSYDDIGDVVISGSKHLKHLRQNMHCETDNLCIAID
jgi:hypothetical protein